MRGSRYIRRIIPGVIRNGSDGMSAPSQVESIFFAALDKKTIAKRARYLDRACGGDAELRCRVERLLEAHPQAADFLARPAVEYSEVDAIDPERPAFRLPPDLDRIGADDSPRTGTGRREDNAGQRGPHASGTDRFARRYRRPRSNHRSPSDHRVYAKRTRKRRPVSGSGRRRSRDACRSPGDRRPVSPTDRRFRGHRST